MRHLTLIALALLVGCTQTSQQNSKITNYERNGNLQINAQLSCVNFEEVSNTNTPADIYPGVVRCILDGQYDQASQLYALAGVYGRFDILRVVDPTAHQAVQALQAKNFSSLSDDQRNSFKSAISTQLQDGSSQFYKLCAKIDSLGPPNYHPAYMIQHGMGGGSGIKSNFNSSQSWKDSLNGYLHCP
jgi:hypothetical protein